MITPNNVKDILKSMYATRSELVPTFIGKPGLGKTQGVEEFAREIGVNLVTFILSNTVPSEISGIRMPDTETKSLEVFDDARMASLKDGDILFFDEILEAPPQIWSACLTLIQSRQMASGRKLPDVFIVAASNPVAKPKLIPESVRDRFMFFNVQFSFPEWRKFIMDKHGVEPPTSLEYYIYKEYDYNILTPRRFDKLLTWAETEGIANIEELVAELFDAEIASKLRTTINAIASPKEQARRAVMEWMNEEDIDYNDNLSLEELIEIVKEAGVFDELAERLAKQAVEGEEIVYKF